MPRIRFSAALIPLLLQPVVAAAYDAEVATTTSAQAYELRGPGGTPVLVRRRITQTLRLGAYTLVPRSPRGPRLDATLLLRLDVDFGVEPEEKDPTRTRAFVPSLEDREVDLVFGYFDGRGYLNGWLDFRAGRQILYDSLGFYAFDGGLVRMVTPWWFLVEGYGGIETQGASPLGPSRWGRDGLQQDDVTDPSLYPSVRPEHLAPVWGVALASNGHSMVHGRATFREARAEGGIGERRFGWAADFEPTSFLLARGHLVYDLGLEVLSEAQAGTEIRVAEPVTASVDWVYYLPTFSLESIWNYFSVRAMNDGRVGLRVRPAPGVEVASTGWVRFFGDENVSPGEGSFPMGSERAVSDTGGDLQARFRKEGGEVTLRLSAAGGYGGNRAGAEAYLMRSFAHDRYRAELFPSVWFYEDDLRVNAAMESPSSALSVGYVVGGLYRFTREANLHLSFEHAVNRIVGNRFRLLAVLDVGFWM